MVKGRGLKGTWPQALATFLFPILLVLTVRWAFFEPFVIPSSSMVPNLLIHDHIIVLKSSIGLKIPFSDIWILKWKKPQRGDVLVFKFPENPNVYYIKRLIGLPGDKVEVDSGRIKVNGEEWALKSATPTPDQENGYQYYVENSGSEDHIVRFVDRPRATDESVHNVPEGHYFFMGDNRDESSDGRSWGFVDKKYLVGHAWLIWLSCRDTLETASYMCDFTTLRSNRFLKTVE